MVITQNFNGDHRHDGLSQRYVDASVICNACKWRAKDDPYEKPMKTMRRVLMRSEENADTAIEEDDLDKV